MKDFKSLQIWQKSHKIVLNVYKLTLAFPKEEMYGLTSQIRRAAVSIPSNIAEGCGRDSDGDLYRFLCIAMGSASELEYQTLLCRDLGFIDEELYNSANLEIIALKKMLNAFIQKVKKEKK